MSQENVELVRQMFGAAGRAMNLGALDELYRLLDPDVEWIPINAALEGPGIAATTVSDSGSRT